MNNKFYKKSCSATSVLFFCLSVFLFCTSVKTANAQSNCMLVPVSLNQRVQKADLIIEGKVISQKSYWGTGHRNIFTSNTIEVYKLFKGKSKSQTIDVITEGGTVEMNKQVLTSTLTLSVGDVGVLICVPNSLAESGRTGYTAYGSLAGFINYDIPEGAAHDPFEQYNSIENDLFPAIEKITKNPAKDIAPNPLRKGGTIKTSSVNKSGGPLQLLVAPTITSFTPTTVASGTGATIVITGTNFGASQGTGYVEFRNADDGGATWIKPLSTDYTGWTNTSITVKVPSTSVAGPGAGTGLIRVTNSDPSTATSAATLTINYAYSNIVSANTAKMSTHIKDNTFGGYTFLLNQSTFASNTPAVDKFKLILNTWTCTTGINWLIGSNTTSVAANDGLNVATFSSSLPAGVLARCISWYSGCGTSPYDWFVSEIDMEVNSVLPSGTTWYYGTGSPSGTQYDFESVLLHEMGHGHQLGHLINSAAVMHYSIANGQAKRTLNAGEISGATFVMNRNTTIGTVCSQPQMTALACNAASGTPLVDFSANKSNITTGCTVSFTNLSAPQTTSWSWNFGGGATNSTLENPSVVFNTPGTYNVSLTATNAAGSNTVTKTGFIVVSAYACNATTTNFTGSDIDYGVGVGRLAGHNGYGDLAFADKFSYCGTSTNLSQLKYHFNKKLGTGNIIVKVWNADGAGGNPGTVLFSSTLAISSLVAYPNPTLVNTGGLSISNDYYIGYQVTYAAGDSVSLITNPLGTSSASTGWRLTTSGWLSYFDSYGSTLSNKVYGVFSNPAVAASVSIAASPAGAICAGTSVTFTATPTNGGITPAYQWQKGGVNIAGATSSTYSSAALINGDAIRVIMTSSAQCATGSPATSTAITMAVNASVAASVSISASPAGAICAGTIVTFTATPTNGGALPTYQWQNGGINIAGATSATYASAALVNGDAIRVIMTSNASCVTGSPATSAAITMVVNSSVAASVSIAALPAGAICAGTSITFTASPTSGGALPTYQWQNGGVNIAGATSATYTSAALVNGDAIRVIMTSNASCVTGSPATSAAITMVVNSSVAASVSIAALPAGAICAGNSVTFTATPTNGGASPTYQWQKAGVNIAGATSSTYTSAALVNGDAIRVIMTSNASCVTGNPATSSAITMTVNPNLPASVSIAALPAGPICAGTSVTFTATPTNGGTTPAYQWQKGGVNIAGATSSTYTSAALVNGDAIRVIMTSNASCVTGSPATSAAITMVVNSSFAASVSIAALPLGAICAGTSVTFTATPTNGGATPTYQWQKGGVNIAGATSSTYTSAALVNGDVIRVIITSNATCVTGNPATSSGITMSVNPNLPASVNIAASPAGAICAGTSVTFTATPGNGGTTPTYQWQKGGVNIAGATSSTYTSAALVNGDAIRVIMTSNASPCLTGSPATSTAITMIVNSSVAASVSIAAVPSGAICAGTSVTFTATPSNGGTTPTYQWQNGGVNIAGATSSTYISSALTNGNAIRVIMTSNASCVTGSPATSTAITMTVNPNLPANVSIAAVPSGAVCAGTSVTFTATPTNGGTTPTYQWQKGGVNIAGATASTFTSAALVNADAIRVIMTSNASPCLTNSPATSTAITMTVNPNLPASVSIAAVPSGAICAGTSVTFTATPTNGGASPTYQWQKGGVNIAGATASTYTSAALVNGNAIRVIMTSNASPCLTGSPATSGSITMTVNPNLPASVSIVASPAGAICSGTSVTFTATPTNGGALPTYQWQKGGVNIAGATSSTYTSAALVNGDVIRVRMTSNATCATGSPANSTGITMVVNICSATLNVRAFIQGYYISGGQMQPVLQNTGMSSNPSVADSITIELHNQATPYSLVSSKRVALLTTGWSTQSLAGAFIGNSYYIAILSRNGVETWSKNPVIIGSTTNFDFTTP